MGKRPLFLSKNIYLDYDDAKDIKKGEKVTLTRWGNAIIDEVNANDNGISFKGHTALEDKDFKTTKKLTWLAKDSPLVILQLLYFLFLFLFKTTKLAFTILLFQ